MRVALDEVPDAKRAATARRLIDLRWKQELRPDVGYMPSMSQRLRALRDAVDLERAVIMPSGRAYLLPEVNVRAVLGDEVVEMWK